MTSHSPAMHYDDDHWFTVEAAKKGAWAHVMRKVRLNALAHAIGAADRSDAVCIMACALDDLGAGMPEYTELYESLRSDAAFWADIATQPELEAYAGAALRRLERKTFGPAARKRILVEMWQTLCDDDRRAFLGAVDPNGHFRGRAQ